MLILLICSCFIDLLIEISGCASLITLLNGLGHCVSLPSTMAYDSAIAQSSIDSSSIVPKGFVPKEYVNLVYDNIDFGEEITKQTHVTNGIITQKVSFYGRRVKRTEHNLDFFTK